MFTIHQHPTPTRPYHSLHWQHNHPRTSFTPPKSVRSGIRIVWPISTVPRIGAMLTTYSPPSNQHMQPDVLFVCHYTQADWEQKHTPVSQHWQRLMHNKTCHHRPGLLLSWTQIGDHLGTRFGIKGTQFALYMVNKQDLQAMSMGKAGECVLALYGAPML